MAVSGISFRFSGLELSRALVAPAALPRSEPNFGAFGFGADFVPVAVLVVVGCAGAGSGEGVDEGGKIAVFAARSNHGDDDVARGTGVLGVDATTMCA